MILTVVAGAQTNLRSWCSTVSFNDDDAGKNDEMGEEFDDLISDKRELQLQGVDPRRGWEFRGVHKVFDVNSSMNCCYWFI